MKYENVEKAVFLNRPNRFIAQVQTSQAENEVVHVKNTGRCRELLIPGCEVWLHEPGTPGRKTRYDLIAVRKDTGVLFNIDSQAPNKVVKEWLATQGFDRVLPEYTYGKSRIDFYMEKTREDGKVDHYLMEVKGCTLEREGMGYFPDAPTTRGVKHVQELIQAVKEGYQACLAFVIQMDGVNMVKPNRETDPAFGNAIAEAIEAGVQILHLTCHVEPNRLEILEENAFPFQEKK